MTEGSPNLEGDRMIVGIGNPRFPVRTGMYRMSLGDQAVFLLAFIACTVRFRCKILPVGIFFFKKDVWMALFCWVILKIGS